MAVIDFQIRALDRKYIVEQNPNKYEIIIKIPLLKSNWKFRDEILKF